MLRVGCWCLTRRADEVAIPDSAALSATMSESSVVPTLDSPSPDGYIAVIDLADELRVRKQTVFKVAKRLGIRTSLRRESARGNQSIATLTPADAVAIRKQLSKAAPPWANIRPFCGLESGVVW